MDDKRKGVHPDLLAKIDIVLDMMRAKGSPMKIVQGLRTAEYQAQLYAQGRTAPGNIVTKCDGYKRKSNHQAKDDGFGHAVDCAFQGAEPFGEQHPWQAYGNAVKAAGLDWGGDWTTPDRPHAELPAKLKEN